MLTEEQKDAAVAAFNKLKGATSCWEVPSDIQEGIFAVMAAVDTVLDARQAPAVEAVLAMQPKPTGKVYQVTEDDAHRYSDVYYNTYSGSYLEDHRAALQDLCDRLGLTQEPTGAAERIAELEAELSAIRSTYAEMLKQAGVESVQDIIDQRDEARANAMTPEAKAVIDAAVGWWTCKSEIAWQKASEMATAIDAYRATQPKKDADK